MPKRKDIYDGKDLERLQNTRRVDEEDPVTGIAVSSFFPTSSAFAITIPANSPATGNVTDIPGDEEVKFDSLYIEFTSSDISTGYTALPITLLADGIVTAFVHTGLRVRTQGTRRFSIYNPTGVSFQVRGFLSRGIDFEIRSPIAYGFDATNSNNYRALSFTGNNELIVVMNGAHANESSPVALNSATQNTQGELAGNAAVVNATVVAGTASKGYMVTAAGIISQGATIGGELILAQFTFSGAPNAIARLAIKTGITDSDHVEFGDSGPVGNLGSAIRVTIVKPFAIGDGWIAWANVRFV